MGKPVKTTDSVTSGLNRAQAPSETRRLSEVAQTAREFLNLDDLMGDLVSASNRRKAEDRRRSRIQQYSHPDRVSERLKKESIKSSAALPAVSVPLAQTHREEFLLNAGDSQEHGTGHSAATIHTADDVPGRAGEQSSIRQPEDILQELEDLLGTGDAKIQEPPEPEYPTAEHPQVQNLPALSTIQTDPCLICGNTSAHRMYAITDVSEEFIECDTCGLGSLFPMPTAARIESFYPAEYYGTPSAKFEPVVEAGVRAGARLRVQSLLSGLQPGSHVLDIGCGRGVMLRALLDLGYTAHGVELSAEAAAGVDPRADVRIAADLDEAGFRDHSMDAIILWHVLEHLPDPQRTLKQIRRILKPDGRLILAVPNYASWQARWAGKDWFHLDLPRHLYHFSPSTLSVLLQRHGFEHQSCHHFAALQNPFGWLQSWFNRVSQAPRNCLYSLLHRDGNHADVRQLGPVRRLLFKAALAMGLPMAGLLSLLEAAAGRGGTIAVTATSACPEEQTAPDRSCREIPAGAV